MKKSLITISVTASLLLCGCSESKNTAEQTAATAAPNNYTAQAEDKTVTGEVVSITGNEVTLALGKLSISERKAPPEMKDGEMHQPPDGEGRPDFKDGEIPDFGGEMPEFKNGEKPDFSNGEKPDFGSGDRPEFNGEVPDFKGERPGFGDDGKGGRGSRKSSASVEKTGEENSYIIPVGMTVTGLSGRSVDYSGINVGMVLTLTINPEGVVCAASVE